ncbi:RAD51-associated protein 1 isoform X3 [Cheilinus undulatus]|uniref:RAD51-associated protein 1 isoform X3 n=1 Tax=Cheilinus undulatus TaxID=241271 RepID=UPI001BD410E3|nr:RAD51-associated protein 1 isoform X3 [Cheilinus undulatus]
MDRPARKSKVVNYCEAQDFDDDEDFACAKAPPSKKAREDVKQEHKRPSSRSSSQESNNSQNAMSQKSRRPLDERLHDRDLEAAIALSLLNNTHEKQDTSLITKADVKVQGPVDENTDPSSLHISNCSVDAAVLGLDEITPEKESHAPSRQRKAAAVEQKKKANDEDDDYEPKMTPDSDSDEEFSEPSESEDEEFTVKKASKAKKKEKVTKAKQPQAAAKKEKQPAKPLKTKSQAAASPPVRSPSTAKPAPKRPTPTSAVSKSKPIMSSSPAGGRIPKWNPPGQIGRSPTSSNAPAGKSPGQGLRLGLSRLVRVKPLHPSVTSH